MTKSELLDKIKRAEKNPLIDASLKASLLKKYNAQLAELEKEEPKKESKSEGSVGKKSKIKDWYLKEYSSDKLGKKLNNDSTFSDLLIAISKGNDVYAVLGVADSVVRERAFAKLSKIENKEGQWAYNTWLSNDEDSEGKKETSKTKTDDLSSVRVIANEMAKNAGFKSAKVDDLGNEAYLIEISPATEENKMAGMVLNKYKDGTFEVAEMQAGKGGNFINVFGEYKTLKPALTQLLKGNKQKPIKVIDMRSNSEKSEDKKEDKKELNEYLKKYDISKGKTYSDGVKNHKLVDFELKDGEWFLIFDDKVKYSVNLPFWWKEVSKSEDKKEAKSEETEEERCQKIIRDAKAASKKARESAKKSAKKPEVTKAKERIERTYEIIENKIEKGSLTKAEVAKLIVETKEVLKMLEKALKSL